MNQAMPASGTEAAVLELLDTALRLERRLDRILAIRGVSFSEYRLLRCLADAESKGRSRIDLAGGVGLTPSAVTRALKPLEKLGYVKTVRNERDARQSLAAITAGGTALLADAQALLTGTFAGLAMNTLSARQLEDFRARLRELRV